MFLEQWKEVAKRAQRFNVNQALGEIWRDPFVQDFIIALNTEGQLAFGKDARDNNLSPEYQSPDYARAKQNIPGRKAPLGIPDLKLFGSFYESFDINVLPDGFMIIADTKIHGRDFIEDYGFDIIGLSDENIQKLIEFIRPIWMAKIEEYLFSGL